MRFAYTNYMLKLFFLLGSSLLLGRVNRICQHKISKMNSITNESSNADVVAWLNEHGLSEAVSEFHGKIRVLLPQYNISQ